MRLLPFAVPCFATLVACSGADGGPPASTPADDTGTTAHDAASDGSPNDAATDTTPEKPVETVWSKTSLPSAASIVALHGTGPDDAWAVGIADSKGTIFHWDGSAWTVSQALEAPGKAVWAVSKSDAWALSDFPGTAWRWNGTSWTKHSTFSVSSVYALFASGANDVWLGSQSNFTQKPVRRFDGTSWKMIDTGSSDGVHGLWGSSSNDLWATGPSLLRWDGAKWTSVEATTRIGALWGSGKNDVWGVGAGGLVRRFDGAAWSDVPSPSKSDLRTVWASGPKDAWAGGHSSFLHWDGAAWADASSKTNAPKSATKIWGSSATDVWVAMGSDVYHLTPKK